MTYTNVFAYEESKGSVSNFSDWSVEEFRIEQPDSSCRRPWMYGTVSIEALNI